MSHPFIERLLALLDKGEGYELKRHLQRTLYVSHLIPEIARNVTDEELRLVNNIFDRLRISSPRFERSVTHEFNRFMGTLNKELPKIKKQRIDDINKAILDKLRKLRISKAKDIVLFLGAGASKPAPTRIPTVNELLPSLWDKARKLETRPLEELEKWCKDAKISNIEELLTALTIANMIVGQKKIHDLINQVLYTSFDDQADYEIRDVNTIQMLESLTGSFFSLMVGTMLDADPNNIHKKTAEIIDKFPNLQVVTTNYDGCIERAFNDNDVPFSYIIGEEPRKTTNIIKMHGSINWYYCAVCQHVLMPTIGELQRNKEKSIPYALTGVCPKCNGTVKQFIVPPTNYKYIIYPPIVEVWDACREAFNKAKVIIIVGYSFGDADDYIAKMLFKSIGEDTNKKMIICDIDKNVLTKFESLISRHIEKYDREKNLFTLHGDASDLYIKVLEAISPRRKKTSQKRAKPNKSMAKSK